jgi:hypothetical protein
MYILRSTPTLLKITCLTWRTMLSRACSSLRSPRQMPRCGPTKTVQFMRQKSYIAPPFLLDDYILRYQLVTPLQEAQKRSATYAHLRNCNLCPRLRGVDRFERRGHCLIGRDVTVNTIAPHFGEEPCLHGHNCSGSVFFSGCNLRCVFCQNHDIAHQKNGFSLQPEELADWYIKLQDGNVHNINLLTPEHVVPQSRALGLARKKPGPQNAYCVQDILL